MVCGPLRGGVERTQGAVRGTTESTVAINVLTTMLLDKVYTEGVILHRTPPVSEGDKLGFEVWVFDRGLSYREVIMNLFICLLYLTPRPKTQLT